MSNITKIGIGVLLVAVVIAGGAFLYMRSASASTSLANMSPNDATAYRYTSMAKYYAQNPASSSTSGSFSLGSGFPLSGTNLQNASALDEQDFNYRALANYYAAQSTASR